MKALYRSISAAALLCGVLAGAARAQDAQPARPTMSNAELQDKIEQLESQLSLLQQTQAEQVANDNAAIKQVAHPDKLNYKGVSITLGGFLEATTIYRDHNLGSDIATPFQNIPFKGPAGPGNPSSAASAGHAEELRESERQSRLSLLVQGDVNPVTHLAMYGEFDFQSAAHTANLNESNSFNPRIRHLYGTVDWDTPGIHLLAGQNWSLATLNTKGITPRNELTPPQIDAQYIPGFVWARQPQVRLTKDFDDKHIWVALSAENPSTTFGPTTVLSTVRTVYNIAGGSGFDSTNNFSLNHAPDIIGKVAYEGMFSGRSLHLEAFGMYRDFYNRRSVNNGVSYQNQDQTGYGGGGSFVLAAVPSKLDVQGSVFGGHGVGRYGSSQLPDVTFNQNGTIVPVDELMFLAGATAHFTPKLDGYVFGGGEHQYSHPFQVGNTPYGLGNPIVRADGCFSETSTAPCAVNTKSVDQVTGGFWYKFYQGPFGRAQWGIQYSYTERTGFAGSNALLQNVGEPVGHENILFTSFRYYPF